jgi:hypothetical protein
MELATVKNHVPTILVRLEICHRAVFGRRLRGGEPTRI